MKESPSNTTGRSLKKQSLLQLGLCLLIIVLVNIISSFVFTRFDLTSEKRFTLSAATKEFLKKLDDVVYVKVYLEGDFPAGFKRLRNATREMLDEFRAYSNGNIEYEFIDPSGNPDPKERNLLYQQLAEKGLQPTNLEETGRGEASQKIIFPGAIFTYRAQETSLQLLKTQINSPHEEMLNNSIQGLEYNLAYTIRKLITVNRPKIGFVQGHGELDKMQLADMTRSLSELYEVDSVVIAGRLNSLKPFRAIVIAGPDSAFDEKDKFIIDQFIMKGGKVLWLIDRMYASMDSLKNKDGFSVSVPKELNLDDQLFRYGVRINADLVQDIQAAPILVNTGYIGNQPQQKLLPWFFSPLVFPGSKHPVVNNLNAIRYEFASSIDTVGAPGIRKTILLTSSRYSRVLYAPVRINLGMMRVSPDPKLFGRSYIPLAILLEGSFSSLYRNRVPPVIAENRDIDFRSSGVPNKMIVIPDGDVIRNDVRKSTLMAYPLGYDRATRQTYGNKSFLLNCIDYLCDESGLLAVRSKELKLRILDHNRVQDEKFAWQIVNVVLPVLVIIIYGLIRTYTRKKKYAK
jgi:ABC-2 type transport system permease protein